MSIEMPKTFFRAVIKRIQEDLLVKGGGKMTRLIALVTHADPTGTLGPGEMTEAQRLVGQKMYSSIPLKGEGVLATYQAASDDLPEIGAGSVVYFTAVGLFTPDWNLRHNGKIVLQPAGFDEEAFSFSCEPKEAPPQRQAPKKQDLVPLTFAAPAAVAELPSVELTNAGVEEAVGQTADYEAAEMAEDEAVESMELAIQTAG